MTPDSNYRHSKRALRHPLAEYANDYRGEDYWTLLQASATDAGVPETIAGTARLLGCGREHAATVATNLKRKGLAALRWDEGRREWRLRATEAGAELVEARAQDG
jgi:hypothetical protein